ncbi:unnamed protein product [Rotaria socialis]
MIFHQIQTAQYLLAHQSSVKYVTLYYSSAIIFRYRKFAFLTVFIVTKSHTSITSAEEDHFGTIKKKFNMANLYQNIAGSLEKPVSKQTVVSAVWPPIAAQQRQTSPVHDRLNTPVSQLHAVTTHHTPYDNIYNKNVINDKTQIAPNADLSVTICYKCKSSIDKNSQPKLTFNNRFYHQQCFKCGSCRKNLSDSENSKFSIDDDGEPLCAYCGLITAKVCTVCGTRIVNGGTINFDSKSYHTDCFRCSQCHRPVADNFAPRCSKCTQPIVLEPAVTCDGKKYHSDCFSCGQCHKPVTDSEYYTHLGEPCCAKCFTERIAFRCAECFRIISDGKSITCDGKHYHSECLHCGQCKKPLATEKDLFKHNEKPCCSRCHEEHFAPRCSKCSRPIKDINYSTYKNQSFHSDCFTCWKCHRVIHSSEKFCTDQAGFLCLTCAK